MRKNREYRLLAAVALVSSLASVAHAVVGVRVIIENRAPDDGTWLTPIWVGFHSGTFDTHGMLLPASAALERLAEDGNVAPLMESFDASVTGAAQGILVSDTGISPLAPGETATMTFVLDELSALNRFFSYGAMVIPSNDAFVGNDDPQAHRIFDASGHFLGGFITVYGTNVNDAGTEVNDEIPDHTAFFGQTEPDTGVDEFSVVHTHPGYLAPGSGGILDDAKFAGADFTAPGYEIARIVLVRNDTVVNSGAVTGTWDLDGSPYLVQGDIIVPSGETLTIEPGVQVVFRCACRLYVEGTLEAIGTEDAPVVFTKDPAISSWGGIHFFNAADDCLLEHCIIEQARASAAPPFNRGAGLFIENSNPVITRCWIRDNYATYGGAGVYCINSAPLLFENTISGNLVGYGVSGRGAGVYCQDSAAEIVGNTIRDNLVSVSSAFSAVHGYGAGIFLSDSNGIIRDNLIIANEVYAFGNLGSTAEGGGIGCRESDPEIIGNTISGNDTSGVASTGREGGGIHLYFSDPLLLNNIVAGNANEGIHFSEYGEPEVGYCDVYGNDGGDLAGEGIPAGLGEIVTVNPNGDPCDINFNIFLDPAFEDAAGGDYHLRADSPCIDAGDPALGSDPDGTPPDIGAFHYDQGVPGDITGDGVVDLADLATLLAAYDTCAGDPDYNPDADFDGDDCVGLADLAFLLAHYGV